MNPDDVDQKDKKTSIESFCGNEEKITRFSDGSSTRHCGGPCGDMHYDEYGEEC
jgi:hypothetical protein